MNIFLLWFSIFAFTLFCLALFPVVLQYRQRGRGRTDFFYLSLMIAYCLWLIVFSVLFFSQAFIKPLSFPVQTVFGILRVIISAFVMILYPALIINSSRNFSLFPGLKYFYPVPVVYFALIVPVFITGNQFIANIISMSFSIYIVALVIMSMTVYKGSKASRALSIKLFLKLSLVYHLVSIAILLVPVRGMPESYVMAIYVLPRAMFCLVWALFELVFYIRREYKKEMEGLVAVPSAFIEDYSITKRERDVIKSICRGMRNKETAEALFISEKTVETHLYSIYRKCRVKSKVELINLISNYN